MTLIEATDRAAAKPLFEIWGHNEVMRHVPSLEWLVRKLDTDLRHRIEKLYASVAALNHDDPRRGPAEEKVRTLCRSIDRLAETARHTRVNQPPSDLGDRLWWSINHAVSCLNSIDPAIFGRRCPYHTFERSKSEPVYSGLAAVSAHVRDLTALVRTIDPDVDERLLDGLVTLQQPLRREPIVL